MKQTIIWIIVILFAGGIAYTRFFKPQIGFFGVVEVDRQIK